MDDVSISKFLSYVLRHEPQAIGLTLGDQGWVDIADLVEKARANGTAITAADVARVAANSDKKRFTLSEDGLRVRAAQGHSVTVDLGLQPVTPPDVLYHGTATRFREPILLEGLKPQARQQVHLSADTETATKVGQRHGKPLIFLVAAGQMHAQGHRFYQADNGVWLTDAVPAEFLSET